MTLVEATQVLLDAAKVWQEIAMRDMDEPLRSGVLMLRRNRPDCIKVRLVLDTERGDVRAYLQRLDTEETTPIAGCTREKVIGLPSTVLN